MGADADMAAALNVVTVEPARILGRRDHRVTVGCRADLVVLDASRLAEAVGGILARVLVVTGNESPERRLTARLSGALDSGEHTT
jgi:cytosine deaminase